MILTLKDFTKIKTLLDELGIYYTILLYKCQEVYY